MQLDPCRRPHPRHRSRGYAAATSSRSISTAVAAAIRTFLYPLGSCSCTPGLGYSSSPGHGGRTNGGGHGRLRAAGCRGRRGSSSSSSGSASGMAQHTVLPLGSSLRRHVSHTEIDPGVRLHASSQIEPKQIFKSATDTAKAGRLHCPANSSLLHSMQATRRKWAIIARGGIPLYHVPVHGLTLTNRCAKAAAALGVIGPVASFPSLLSSGAGLATTFGLATDTADPAAGFSAAPCPSCRRPCTALVGIAAPATA
jgi:hypothetical protein